MATLKGISGRLSSGLSWPSSAASRSTPSVGRNPASPHGIRITKLGAVFVGLVVLVALAAINTGNNALFLLFGQMLTLLAVSGWLSRTNLTKVSTHLEVPQEIYAKGPMWGAIEVENFGRRWSRRWLRFKVDDASDVAYCDQLEPGARRKLDLRMIFRHRGHHDVDSVLVSSLFPFGFFRKGMRLQLQQPILIYPELFPEGGSIHPESGRFGDLSQSRLGHGPELHSLRPYRPGDDPRRIHWKKSAHSGEVVVWEREAEGGRRFTVLFDNGFGDLVRAADRARFESLVSEAATAVHNYLKGGFEVELITRDQRFAASEGQRHYEMLLTHLALVQPVGLAEGAAPLTAPLGGCLADSQILRLAMAPASRRGPGAEAQAAAPEFGPANDTASNAVVDPQQGLS